MDLKQIRYFVNVANLKSFSRAAGSLNVAQSALSRHIQALESELKTQLLFRTTRGVEVTDTGAILLTMGEALLAQVEDIRTAVQRGKDLPTGNVSVGLPPSLSAILAPIIIEECNTHYPGVSVRIIEGLVRFLEEWLRLGKIDLAVLTDFGDPTSLAMSRIAREEMVLVAARGTIADDRPTIPLEEVTKLDLTITHGFRTVVDRLLEKTGHRMNYVEEFDSIPVILDRILGHPLFTILPRGFVRGEELTGRLKVTRITDPVLTRDLVLATNPRRARTGGMQAVSAIISRRISDVLVD